MRGNVMVTGRSNTSAGPIPKIVEANHPRVARDEVVVGGGALEGLFDAECA
jgi:hypothetical protein